VRLARRSQGARHRPAGLARVAVAAGSGGRADRLRPVVHEPGHSQRAAGGSPRAQPGVPRHLAGSAIKSWRNGAGRIAEIEKVGLNTPAPEAFEALVSRKLCDSAILRDRTAVFDIRPLIRSCHRCRSLRATIGNGPAIEYQERNPTAAAEAYADIANRPTTPTSRPCALQARPAAWPAPVGLTPRWVSWPGHWPIQIRASGGRPRPAHRTGRPAAGLRLMKQQDPRFEETLAPSPAGEQLSPDRDATESAAVHHARIARSGPDRPLPTLAAEDLADSYPARRNDPGSPDDFLHYCESLVGHARRGRSALPATKPGQSLWQIELSGGTIVALYRQASIIDAARSVISSRPLSEATVELVPRPSRKPPANRCRPWPSRPDAEWRLNAYWRTPARLPAQPAGRKRCIVDGHPGIVVIALLATLVAATSPGR